MVLYELMHTGSRFAVRQVPAALRFFSQPNQVRFVRLTACGKKRLPVCKRLKSYGREMGICRMYCSPRYTYIFYTTTAFGHSILPLW